MQNSEFEKSVQQKMNELKVPPHADLWQKIEPKLPAPGKDRRWLLFFFLMAVLTGASILTWDGLMPANENHSSKRSADTNQPAGEDLSKGENDKNVNKTTLSGKNSTAKLPVLASNEEKDAGINDNTKHKPRAANNYRRSVSANSPGTSTSPSLAGSRTRNRFKAGAFAKTKISSPAPSGETIVGNIIPGELSTRVINISPGTAATSVVVAPVPSTKVAGTEMENILPDTTRNGNSPPLKKEKRPARAWVYGIHLGAGISNVKTSLFGDSGVFADSQGSLSSGSPGSGSPTYSAPPVNPRAGGSFEAGVYFKRELNNHWSFSTGVNYTYQSNSLRTGTWVDSTALARFSTSDFITNSFYRTGNSATYRNHFHMLALPLLLEYRFNSKVPISAEFGPAINYLLQTNTLVYNKALGAYVTNDKVFNKLLVSLKAGAGMDLQKFTGLPLRLGYRFQYSLGSVTKTTFGKQHLLNSTFYLDVPLKK